MTEDPVEKQRAEYRRAVKAGEGVFDASGRYYVDGVDVTSYLQEQQAEEPAPEPKKAEEPKVEEKVEEKPKPKAEVKPKAKTRRPRKKADAKAKPKPGTK